MLTIKILGPGCANCRKLEQIVKQALESTGVDAEVIEVTDTREIMAYDILHTPGLVINEKVVSSGRIPTPGSVVDWIKGGSRS